MRLCLNPQRFKPYIRCGWIRELYMRRNICWGNICFNLRNTPITLEILIEIFRICGVQVMFWSIVMPKKLNSWTSSIWLPLAHMLSLRIILGCLKNIMNFDLEALSFNLLLWSQVVILEIVILECANKEIYYYYYYYYYYSCSYDSLTVCLHMSRKSENPWKSAFL